MSIIQIAGVGVIGTLLALQFKSGKSEYGIYTVIAISLVLFYGMKDRLIVIEEAMQTISSLVTINASYIQILLKLIGITYIAEFATGICRDAGYSTIGCQIEIFSKLTILALSMPILEALLLTIKEFLQ
ncbi:MAG: SpoIIIAC/SpoIIIAD family protein [bacterium]|nr:SpoIIIAC/SpoIIIAD family protein [bacterium]